MRSYLDFEDIEMYMDVITHYVHNPKHHYRGKRSKGANKIDLSKIVLIKGGLVKDESYFLEAIESLAESMKYVESGDGFYTDGSFIQHQNTPYNGTYGNVLLSGVVDSILLLEDTKWKVNDAISSLVIEHIKSSLQPFLYKGMMMDMVNGRAISREGLESVGVGIEVIETIIKASLINCSSELNDLLDSIYSWDRENPLLSFDKMKNQLALSYYLKNKPLADLVEYRDFTHYQFPNMDRIVHVTPDFTFGLSMHSSRISAFESGNGENNQGIHTGDGMTYILNEDFNQYNGNYWPTVGMNRLASTTISSGSTLALASDWSDNSSDEDFVGGTGLNNIGIGAMQLNRSYSEGEGGLVARKSWFMFDDEVVCLGSGIEDSNSDYIKTIVENRKISYSDSLKVSDLSVVNLGQSIGKMIDWLYLDTGLSNSSIGYIFPNSEFVLIKNRIGDGSWRDINENASTEAHENQFLEILISHSDEPMSDSYEYVLLPSVSYEAFETYTLEPDVEILENNNEVHIVRDNEIGYTGYVFWSIIGEKVHGLSVNKPCIVLMRDSNGKKELSVSDPTMKLESELVIQVAYSEGMIFSGPDNATSEIINDEIVIRVDLSGNNGGSTVMTIYNDLSYSE